MKRAPLGYVTKRRAEQDEQLAQLDVVHLLIMMQVLVEEWNEAIKSHYMMEAPPHEKHMQV